MPNSLSKAPTLIAVFDFLHSFLNKKRRGKGEGVGTRQGRGLEDG